MTAMSFMFSLLSLSTAVPTYFDNLPMFILDSPVVVSPIVIDIVPISFPNITCDDCEMFMRTMKNETDYLNRMAEDVQYVCGRIFGLQTNQCLQMTKDIKKGLEFLSQNNSTFVCKHLHYCN